MTKTTIINENNVKTVTAVEQNACTVYAYGEDQYLNSEGPFFVGKRLVSDSTASRLYAVLEMPELPSNAKIRGAQLSFEQTWVSYGGSPVSPIGIYRVNGEIDQESFTPDDSLIALLDWDNIAGSGNTGISETYDFDITAVIEEYISDPTVHTNFLIKLVNESQVGGLTFSDSSLPVFKVIYEENDGASGSYQSHSHELGSFGRSSVDIVKGDLTLDFSDFEWSGNRMPVAISHRYSSVYAGKQYTNGVAGLSCGNFSGMKLGHGFKLNIMESMKSASFVYNSNSVNGYRYIDGYNDSRYFVPVSGGYAAVDDSDIKYSSSGRTLTGWSEVKTVDSSGRVVRTSDEYGNNIDVTYSSNRITSVKDGAGRSFAFGYDSAGHLTSITAPDGNSADYSYTGELLTGVTCPDGRSVVLAYDSAGRPTSVILKNSSGVNVGKTEYAYSNGRVATVTEYGASGGSFVKIAATTYSYSPITRRGLVRTVQETGGTTQYTETSEYVFDVDGNVISEYSYNSDTSSDAASDTGVKSGYGETRIVNNMLLGHGFDSLTRWTEEDDNSGYINIICITSEDNAKFGKSMLSLSATDEDGEEKGVYQNTPSLSSGKYMLSGYFRVNTAFEGSGDPGVYLRVTDTSGNIIAESEHLDTTGDEHARIELPFSLTASGAVCVRILTDGAGNCTAEGIQLENGEFAGNYNMLSNSNFEFGLTGWSTVGTVSDSTAEKFNMSHSAKLTGGLKNSVQVYQTVENVKSKVNTRETFTLSGWAKGNGLPKKDRAGYEPSFCLRARITYSNGQTEDHTAEFSPTYSSWQYGAVTFAKEKYLAVSEITVYCDYINNNGTAYFDAIQLVRDSIETGLSESEFNGSSGSSSSSDTVEELRDSYGNVLTGTECYSPSAGSAIYTSYGYSSNGNDLIRETDPRGNNTYYSVDANTSRVTSKTDRVGNVTQYQYDAAGRTTRVTSKNSAGSTLAYASYGYNGRDDMTYISRGDGMRYDLTYNSYGNLASIGINGKSEKLAQYAYKSSKGRLKSVTYANGDRMAVSYNSRGQVISEKWYNGSNVLTASYKYSYDPNGNLARSLDITRGVEYTYNYEGGRIVRARECTVTVNSSGEITARTLVGAVQYSYDNEGTLKKKKVIYPGAARTVSHGGDYGNAVQGSRISYTAGGVSVSCNTGEDRLDRRVYDTLVIGSKTLRRDFSYVPGTETDEHTDNDLVVGTGCTRLIESISYSDGRRINYTYDAEDRITKVVDTVDGTTVYTYDALGQLLTEKVNGSTVNTMAYDGYGNILTKNGKSYTYGDSAWKDKLTAYNGQSISYDAQGNPTNYLGHTLTWEKGRQLKSFDTNTYTYNANGIRTGKTVGGVIHKYILDGTRVLKESWGSNVLAPLYDNHDSVCGIEYNGSAYFFVKNLQGDVISIANSSGTVVARYTYDAWGACTVTSDTSGCNISAINPYRYHSYYYDTEIGLYYVSSRYYDPEIGRWISPEPNVYNGEFDEAAGLLAYNVYAYCANNPVMFKDETGEGIILACVLIFGGIGMLLGAGHGAASSYKKTGQVSWKSTIGWAFVGGIVGAAIGYGVGVAIGASGLYVSGSGGKALLKTIQGTRISNKGLSNWIKECFRYQGKIGNGGLSDAIRYELRYNKLVGGKSHIQKGIERVTGLKRIISKGDLTSSELALAKKLLDDLESALRGK